MVFRDLHKIDKYTKFLHDEEEVRSFFREFATEFKPLLPKDLTTLADAQDNVKVEELYEIFFSSLYKTSPSLYLSALRCWEGYFMGKNPRIPQAEYDTIIAEIQERNKKRVYFYTPKFRRLLLRHLMHYEEEFKKYANIKAKFWGVSQFATVEEVYNVPVLFYDTIAFLFSLTADEIHLLKFYVEGLKGTDLLLSKDYIRAIPFDWWTEIKNVYVDYYSTVEGDLPNDLADRIPEMLLTFSHKTGKVVWFSGITPKLSTIEEYLDEILRRG